MALRIRTPEGFGAATVGGLALEDADDPARAQMLRELLWERGVVAVHLPAPLDDSAARAIASMIGPIKDPVAVTRDGTQVRYSDDRQVIDSGFVMTEELREQLGGGSLGGDDVRPGLFEFFHTDDSYTERPAAATVLHARALPPSGGGATSFLDMRAAYRLLDVGVRDRLHGLRARHAYNNHDAFPPRQSASGPLDALVDVHHPVVRAHPVTREPALYFDLDRACEIDGLPVAAGRELLQSLQDHAERNAPRYAHPWQPHDVLMWDNAAVQHRAGGDFKVGEPRRFWRFMIEGPRPAAA
jgi:alpha-ketoglutarate-dependent taurine dioxygenase